MWVRLGHCYIAQSTAIVFVIMQRRTEEPYVAEHFHAKGHTLVNMPVVAINQPYSRDSCLHKIRESKWLRTLRTSHPFGMNLMQGGFS